MHVMEKRVLIRKIIQRVCKRKWMLCCIEFAKTFLHPLDSKLLWMPIAQGTGYLLRDRNLLTRANVELTGDGDDCNK